MLEFFKTRYSIPYSVLAILAWYGINMLGPQSKVASAVLGFLLVFLVPGYAWVVSMDYDDPIEEFVVAVAVSISLVIISLIVMNMTFGILITQASVYADILVISLAGLLYWWKREEIEGMMPDWARELVS